MLVSFELTMPNKGSWNGRWSGEDKKYYIIENLTLKTMGLKHLQALMVQYKASWYYSWGDGWGANVSAEIIDANEAKKRRKISKGFCGYDWMVSSILKDGTIQSSSDRRMAAEKLQLEATKL
jgi:hypothetical protein